MIPLRMRILGAIAATGVLGACGARTGTSSGTSSLVDASVTTDAGASDARFDVVETCPSASKPEEQCLTRSKLEAMWNNPPIGGDEPFDAGPAPFDRNGCLPRDVVQNGCCIRAFSGPRFQGGVCCYTFCTGGCCGRPLVVDGVARMATVVERADWSGSVDADAALPPRVRSLLADLWCADARMEHASVASFARFALELLAVGAPPDLVLGAHRAAQDEVLHAKDCFALASRFAGKPLGPGPLDVSGCIPESNLAGIVLRAVIEGCVGETVAAVVATEQLAHATDPQSKRALERIATDEAEHSLLAWRFVAWALAGGDPSVKSAAARGLRAALEGFPELPRDGFSAYGRLAPRDHLRAVERARREIVAPAAEALSIA